MDGGRHNGFISKPYTRTGDNSAQDGLVEYSIEAKPEIKSIFKDAELPTPSFNKLKKNNKQSMDAFKNAIAKAKQSLGDYGASVELKDDYTDINLYLSEDGESGFGIKPNGDIVSVFSNNKAEGGRSAYMLEMAISQGGRQLDCFDVYLVEIYEAHGFKPVAKMKWDDEYIPEGWNKDNFKDYNNGEKFQHMYKWRSPAEREAIYNNMLERYKNAKTTEELKKVVFDNDKPLEVFNRQLDDLGSLSKEQAQSIRAEYSKRYLELIKDENPEEYKKNKKYLEKKYNIKSDASIYIDSLIDTIEYIDAKKKEFKEADVNRDEDGKFAEKPSSNNKSNDNGKKDIDIEITDNDRYEYMVKLYRASIGEKDGYISETREQYFKNNLLKDAEKVKAIDNDIKYSRGLEKSDKDKYNKYKEYKETAEYKEKMKKAINQFEGDTKATAEKLYSENLKAGELILDKDGKIDNAKINKLNKVEKGIQFFTVSYQNRDKQDFKSIKKNVKDLINKSIPKEIPLYRHETIYESDERYNFEVGKTIKMDVRSFCNSENAFDSCRALQLWNNAPHKDVIFKIEGEVKSLEIESLSKFLNQKEHLVNGNFEITEIREATLTMPKIVTIKAKAR